MNPKERKGVKSLLELDYNRISINCNITWFQIYWKALANAGFRAIFFYRIGRYHFLNKRYKIAGFYQRLMHHTSYCWISVSAEIGPGFLIAHVSGIIIGGETKIGSQCDVRQNVTLGGNFNKSRLDGSTQPIVGNNVSMGAGCVILGPVQIGNHSIIGANSVVNRDVPDGVIVFGVPAKIIRNVWEQNRKL